MATSLDAVIAAPPVSAAPHHRHRIDDWRPEDAAFWAERGSTIARRNLVCSIASEHVGFCIWSMWSVLVLFLGPDYGFTPSQKFMLTTVPTAVGAVLRLPYTFAVARFGGRNWTIASSLFLLVPAGATLAVLRPGVSFGALLFVAALAGIGGGNFSSSMANIDSFYPQHLKGWALGLNAGGGNIGVAAVQLVGLAVLATAGKEHPRIVIAVYLPLIVLAAIAAAVRMDNLTQVRNDRRAMRDAMREPHAWVMAFLYTATFGSFIGFGFAFGQVLQVQFADTFDTPIRAAYLTFLGPLLGSLLRPVGGRLADRLGGARVTVTVFLAMTGGAAVILAASKAESLVLFVVGFVVLFVLTGLGNGSTYKMIPSIFAALAERKVAAGHDPDDAARDARRLSRALIGVCGAVGALGGVAVNLALRQSFLDTGRADSAYLVFMIFYAVCLAVTWAVYLRPSARRLEGV